MLLAQHLHSTNDANGNPRRVWTYQLVENGYTRMVACIDEGYSGQPHVNGRMREGPYKRHRVVELTPVATTPAEYKEFVHWGKQLASLEGATP